MSPAKIKQHEPTAVRRDFTDQKIVESRQERVNDDTREKVEKPIGGQDKQETKTTTTVPLTEENLGVSKRESEKEDTIITKKLVTETKTVEVPVTHEEISVERRKSATGRKTTESSTDRPVESEQEE